MAHPSYLNPTIQEALCEFQFQSGPKATWTPAKPGALVKALAKEYPDFETFSEQGFEVGLSPDGSIVPGALAPRLRIRFSAPDKPMVVQVSQTSLAVHVVGNYDKWDVLKAEILHIWSKAMPVLVPLLVSRIGLRYINRIPRKAALETPRYWLKPSRTLPEALLDSLPDPVFRLEVITNEHERCVTHMLVDRTRAAEAHGALMFDIDRITFATRNPGDPNLPDVLEALHDAVWEIFDSAKGENLDKYLNEGKRESAA